MNIAVLRKFEDPLLLDSLKAFTHQEYTDLSENIPSAETIAQYEIILGWDPVIEEALKLEHKIKWIQLWMVGVDNLPLELLEKEQVIVTTARGANATTIAQQTIGYLLMFARQLHLSRDYQTKQQWFNPTELTELTDKTALTVGTGEIGQAFAKLANAFGIIVDGVNRTGHCVEYLEECYPIEQLDELLGKYDYIINNLPYTPETDKLFSTEQFKNMTPDTIFINMGRGKSVDEIALITALQTKQIKAAALDVFEEEPLSNNSPLWQMENVIITPHRAGISNFYDGRIAEIFINNFKQYIQGETPSINRLDYQKGY